MGEINNVAYGLNREEFAKLSVRGRPYWASKRGSQPTQSESEDVLKSFASIVEEIDARTITLRKLERLLRKQVTRGATVEFESIPAQTSSARSKALDRYARSLEIATSREQRAKALADKEELLWAIHTSTIYKNREAIKKHEESLTEHFNYLAWAAANGDDHAREVFIGAIKQLARDFEKARRFFADKYAILDKSLILANDVELAGLLVEAPLEWLKAGTAQPAIQGYHFTPGGYQVDDDTRIAAMVALNGLASRSRRLSKAIVDQMSDNYMDETRMVVVVGWLARDNEYLSVSLLKKLNGWFSSGRSRGRARAALDVALGRG